MKGPPPFAFFDPPWKEFKYFKVFRAFFKNLCYTIGTRLPTNVSNQGLYNET
jgi:hypothetical protein